MSEVDYTLDEYVQGTPDRQARYIYDFRLKLANLSTVVGSELAGRVEILDKVVTHSSTLTVTIYGNRSTNLPRLLETW